MPNPNSSNIFAAITAHVAHVVQIVLRPEYPKISKIRQRKMLKCPNKIQAIKARASVINIVSHCPYF